MIPTVSASRSSAESALPMTRLAEFIRQEMKRLNLVSEREFARHIGVSNTTINRALGEDPPTPSGDFLIKLAKATGISICTVSMVAFAETFPEISDTDREIRLLAERIRRLPAEQQAVIKSFLSGNAL